MSTQNNDCHLIDSYMWCRKERKLKFYFLGVFIIDIDLILIEENYNCFYKHSWIKGQRRYYSGCLDDMRVDDDWDGITKIKSYRLRVYFERVNYSATVEENKIYYFHKICKCSFADNSDVSLVKQHCYQYLPIIVRRHRDDSFYPAANIFIYETKDILEEFKCCDNPNIINNINKKL